MSTVFDDFTGNTPPAEPAGWTKVNYNTWTIPTASGGSDVIAQDQANGAGNRVHFLVHTATGSVDGASQVLEVVSKFRIRSGEVGFQFHRACSLLVQSTDGSSLGGYSFGADTSTTCSIYRLSSAGSPSGIAGATASIGFTLAEDTWYWQRFRREIDGQFKGRIWADGGAEPGTWTEETTVADTTYTTGHVGVGGNVNNTELDFDLIAIGLGESAPTSAAATPVGQSWQQQGAMGVMVSM